ncbi:MAG: PASTA domain-containing protein [Treponema sp.]|jgi:beta-lactam-binding protein with PASTA domain|nr:PASTA domain-containing protein [Treponema sp.]
MGFINLDLDAVEAYVSNHLRLFLSMAAGILVFVGIIAVSVFFIALRGEEEIMVPEVRGKDLTAALLDLQVKELYPRILLRYSQTSADRGLILEQDPLPGTIVKAGRRIRLVVSQGVMINKVENYLGRNIDEVRVELQALFASASSPLLSLKEPFMYEYSAESPGTILHQRPEPGSDISGPTVLDLVISRGPENTMINMPNLVGLSLEQTLEQIGRTGVDFTFTLRPAGEGEKAGTVTAQNPPGDTTAASNTRLAITMASPLSPDDGQVFGLFVYPMPKNPYPHLIRLEALLPSGERLRLLSVEYAGGELSVPYRLPPGSVLILSMLNREIHRETVTLPGKP